MERTENIFEDSDRTRRELNATGRYLMTNPNAPKENAGFHWNALCAMNWGRLAELYLRAKAAARKDDVSLIQQFYQKRLALAWREYLEDYKLDIIPGGYLRAKHGTARRAWTRMDDWSRPANHAPARCASSPSVARWTAPDGHLEPSNLRRHLLGTPHIL